MRVTGILAWPAVMGALLAACGTDIPIAVGEATADHQWRALVTASGDLKLFDPEVPDAAAIAVDANVDPANAVGVLGGRFRSSDNSLADPHVPWIAYLRQGKVYRLSLLNSAIPVPEQVSSVTGACRFRGLLFDYAEPLNSRFAVETSGADGQCGQTADNAGRYFALGDSDAAPGTAISPTEFSLRDSIHDGTGALTHVLVREGPAGSQSLMRYTASRQGAQLIAALQSGSSLDTSGPEPSADMFYFHLQPAGTAAPCLYRYSAGSNALSSCLHPYSLNQSLYFTSESDASHIYYAFGNLAYRLPHNSTGTSPIRTGSVDRVIGDLRLSPTRVILNGVDNAAEPTPYYLESIPRTGGTVIPLKAASSNALTLSAVARNRVYFSDISGAKAITTLDDGSGPVELGNAGWGAFSRSADRISIGGLNGYADQLHGIVGIADVNSVVTITSFDAGTGAVLGNLGSIPYASSSYSNSFGRYRLTEVTVFRPESSTSDRDVYFADTLTPGSLRALATTIGADDRVIY